MGSFLNFFFIFNDSLLLMLLQFSQISPVSTSPSTPISLQSPHRCSCPWVIRVISLAAPFPIMFFTSHGYSVTTYLYFLIPSPLHPFSDTFLPSGNDQTPLCVHDSVSVLVCLVCFLDSIVNRYVLITILLFMVLIFFFLDKSL